LRLVIAERDLAPFFKTVWGAPATKVEAFGRILRDHRYEAARVVAIGDSMTEFWAAEALGIPFLGIANGSAAPFPARVPTEPTLQNVGALLASPTPEGEQPRCRMSVARPWSPEPSARGIGRGAKRTISAGAQNVSGYLAAPWREECVPRQAGGSVCA
jgi:hypothetical protein